MKPHRAQCNWNRVYSPHGSTIALATILTLAMLFVPLINGISRAFEQGRAEADRVPGLRALAEVAGVPG